MSAVKGPWEKAEVLSKALLPIVVALLGLVISWILNNNQVRDADSRLYTELVTKREDADTSLRRSMFESVLKTFLESRPGGSERDILNLELLAYNFHETLNLKSLFLHVQEQIAGPTEQSSQLQARLVKLAKEVSVMEQDALAQSGAIAKLEFYPLDGRAPFHEGIGWVTSAEGLASIQSRQAALRPTNPPDASSQPNSPDASSQPNPPELVPGKNQRYFSVNLINVDRPHGQVSLQLQVYAPGVKTVLEVSSSPDLGYFDFPMVENIRLSQGERCAAVLTELSEVVVHVSLVFFPGSRASLKDKPYYDEVLDELHKGKNQ